MFRRAVSRGPSSITAAGLPAMVGACNNQIQTRKYRIHPHIDEEIEELHDVQKIRRWSPNHLQLQSVPTPSENLCNELNAREARRTGAMPERALARDISQVYTEDGTVSKPAKGYEVMDMTITIIGLDGHPFYIKTKPTEPLSINQLINFSGCAIGWMNFFSLCNNVNCYDWQHGDGCLVNVDIDTLSKLTPPARGEYYALNLYRYLDRGDVKFNSRFSCCLRVTAAMDGAVIAMKQYYSRALKEAAMGQYGPTDAFATVAQHRCRRIEPWAPMLEEPTKQDFPFTFEMIWADSWEDIMKHKYPKYRRSDGMVTKPRFWSSFV